MGCRNNHGLGSCAFARHYLRNHSYFLFLWVLRCFSSPRSLTLRCDWPSTSRVAPFGYHGINGYLHLPRAFRSLSRPSSPPRAKASTVCPSFTFLSLPHTSYTRMHTMTVGLFIFNSFYVFFSLIRFKFHSYSFDLHTYIKQHTKSFLCFVHHVKELFLRFFNSAFFVVQESSSFINASGRLRNLWRITDSNR